MDELREAIKRHKSAVYVLPTGGGKTVVAGLIAQRVTERGGQVMLVVHRRELVKQAVDTLTEFVPGLDVGVEAPGLAVYALGTAANLHGPEHGAASTTWRSDAALAS